MPHDLWTHPDVVQLELFANRFAAIAVDMGELLRRTALCINTIEGESFSCAVLDPVGRLVTSAPDVPLHLGSLGPCVRSLSQVLDLQPGDVALTNHPAHGSCQLADLTVVTPVFASDEPMRLLGYVANRTHHVEIGGARPGSVSATATCLAEEGVVIPPLQVVRRDSPRFALLREILTAAPHPSRSVEDSLADVAAAIAANNLGCEELQALAADHGAETLAHSMEALRAHAAEGMRQALSALPDGLYQACEALDDGAQLRVTISISGTRAVVDFAGSAPVHPGNLNAPLEVVRSATLYALRLLAAAQIPLNEGLLEPVELRVPEGLLNPRFPDDPRQAPAVFGGNVETGQRAVDTLLKALGGVACSQGTVNSVIFGDNRFGYCETVAGGGGAGAGFPGAHAVHSHLCNARAIDPEVLEQRYPVRLERFAIRRGSGGRGRHRGGDGTIRELRFLRPLSLAVLGQHRTAGPYGMDGGEPGSPGAQRLVRPSGETVELGWAGSCKAEAGDRLILETPGGGGWGEP